MQKGLYAEYEEIRIWSSSTFTYDYFTCFNEEGIVIGGVDTYIYQILASGQLLNILESSSSINDNFGYYFYISLLYRNHVPPGASDIIDFSAYLFGDVIFSHFVANYEPDPIPFPSYINTEFILKNPRFYFEYSEFGRICL